MNPEQLRAIADLLTHINKYNDEGEPLSVKVTNLTITTDGGEVVVLNSDEEGLYVQV